MVEPRSGQPRGTIFAGRQRAMETLTTALDDAMPGRRRLVMLAGEPGIGKTRLAEELAKQAPTKATKVRC